MSLDKAAKAQLFEQVLGMAVRWGRYWPTYSASPTRTQMRERPKLAGAVSSFMLLEFKNHPALRVMDEDSDLRYDMAIAFLSKAIPLSKTHGEDFVLDTFALMGIGKVNTRLPAKMTLFFHRILNKWKRRD
jgi:hypothetical protein